jgi:hypothetical protein
MSGEMELCLLFMGSKIAIRYFLEIYQQASSWGRSMWLMPCFEIPNHANEEGRSIGLILVGYGELETTLLACVVA